MKSSFWNDEKKRIELLFIAISLVYGVFVSLGKSASDDAIVLLKMSGAPVSLCWTDAAEGFYSWSSRVLVNFICNFTLAKGKIASALFMAVSMYAVLKSLYVLFDNGRHSLTMAWLICGAVLLFPFDILTSAGWVATTTSYFIPQACMLVALIPIRKMFEGERMKWWEFCLYALALVLASNTEQPCVVLLALYAVTCCYLLIKKKFDFRAGIMLMLTIASLVVIIVCPGNHSRQSAEVMNWFPTYGMLDTIDKADLGISTTLKWMFVDKTLIIIFSCMMMTYFVWKRYKDWSFRLFSLIPSVATILLGPGKKILTAVYPYCKFLTEDIDYYGVFNVASSGTGRGVLQFFALLFIALMISVNVILLNDSIEGMLCDFSLILAGTASRAMMGFSPTVYASSTRTFSTLVVCIIVADIHIFSHNIEMIEGPEWLDGVFKIAMSGLVLLGLANLAGLVIYTFA